jgi:hypothetical protein
VAGFIGTLQQELNVEPTKEQQKETTEEVLSDEVK